MRLIRPEDWRPRGIEDLEPEAWRALGQHGSACVIAGPGAGKTEFLAQKAAYLLETGLCPAPTRVLAISFKRDAAENLAARVQRRCAPKLAGRFVSLTFDAFTKGLVDRFQAAIPAAWRPTRPYEIHFPSRRAVAGFLNLARLSAPPHWQAEIAGISEDRFEALLIGSHRLPITPAPPATPSEFVLERWWRDQLRVGAHSSLSFVSLNRLAEVLLRANPHIMRALRATYPVVFVDEFQDTTYAQYDFLLSTFGAGRTEVTGVGDDKQRIMVWAGARTDVFERLRTDFRAERIQLVFNHRSSPDLVRIQHVVARALDPHVAAVTARAERQVDGDVAQIWTSVSIAREAEHLGRWIAADMAARGRSPRDYAILVKQKADGFEGELAPALGRAGVRVRNESHELGRTTLQDLLADTFCGLVLATLRLGAVRRHPLAWTRILEALISLRGFAPDDEMGKARVEELLSSFLRELRARMAGTPPSAESAVELATSVINLLDPAAVARSYLEYAVGDLLEIVAEALLLHLATCAEATADWPACLDAFEGVDRVPLMTVHKSKGLEYDTVIFVGLDDQTWWAHTPGDREGLATFFVALSRAKQRAIFAFCQGRGQQRKVAELRALLSAAGVPEVDIP